MQVHGIMPSGQAFHTTSKAASVHGGPDFGHQIKKKFNPLEYKPPEFSPIFSRFLDPFNLYILSGIKWARSLPGLNNRYSVGGPLLISQINLSPKDAETLKTLVRPDTAVFIAHNHPEYTTDILIDKELARQFYPKRAIWAYHGLVNYSRFFQKFWLWNNVIATVPETQGGKGKEYSVDWALKGNVVCLYPEGSVHYTNDHVHPLFPGTAELAIQSAKKTLEQHQQAPENPLKPVYIVPVVWKMQFTKDVSAGLHEELDEIETTLNLPKREGEPLANRFFTLQKALLDKSVQNIKAALLQSDDLTNDALVGKKQRLLKFIEATQVDSQIPDSAFFENKAQLTDLLLDYLRTEYGSKPGSTDRQLRHFYRAVSRRKKADEVIYAREKGLVDELNRLLWFSPEIYNKPHLTQEQVAESLKRIKRDWYDNSLENLLRKYFLVPAGPRNLQVKVAEPINVLDLVQANVASAKELEGRLTEETRRRMQAALHEINQEIAPDVQQYQIINAFYNPMLQALPIKPPQENPFLPELK